MDNSEFMRNGDYTPTRFDAQVDCVNQLFTIKTNRNPESAVGLMSMGGQGPEVLATLTTDHGKILAGIHDTKIAGEGHLTTGIQVAALALKHRLNKLQRQRVIVFVGSPVEEDTKALVKLAKKMKKNNVAVDFVNFGEEATNTEKLEKFIEAVNSGDNSHLVTIPPGPHLLSDILRTSPIIQEDGDDSMDVGGGMGGAAGGSNDADFEFGVDPSVDPELALALRMSLEDEKARLEKESKPADKLDPVKEEPKEEGGDVTEVKKEKEHEDHSKKDDDKMDTSG